MAQAKISRSALNIALKKIGRSAGNPKATKRLKLGIKEIDDPLLSLLGAGWQDLPYALPPGTEPPLFTVREALFPPRKTVKKRKKRRAAS